jgi:DNA-binding LacI/PurR family transcriptional regulator
VSFAFNNPDKLSPATASRILEVAASMGYRPHPVARMLTQRHTMSIGVVTPQSLATAFANRFFGQLSEGIALVAEEAGYGLAFIAPERGSLSAALDRATVDGLLAIGLPATYPEIDRLRSAGIPLVQVDSTALPDSPSIMVDDEGGAYSSAAHILDLGHRDVLTVVIAPGAPFPPGPDHGVGPDRLRGYQRAFVDRGLEFPRARIIEATPSIDAGARALTEAWMAGMRPTAVIAMSDAIAFGVMAGARSLGLRVPADLSIIGFDDVDMAVLTDPPLTTVNQPVRGKGEAAMRLLLDLVAHRDVDPLQVRTMPTRLIVRGSTGPPP